MKRNSSFVLRVLALSALCVGTSHATLIDRGGGLIYDDVLNVTWLQDASSPTMNWDDAMSWVSNLNYFDSVRGVTYDDWRLPATFVNDRSAIGWDTSGMSSELAYMYYVNLGYSPAPLELGTPEPTSANYNPFLNLVYRGYWSGTPGDSPTGAWAFHFHFGYQDLNAMNDGGLRAWAVRDGDVRIASVPEPGTLALFGASLLAAGLVRRRRLAK